MSRKPWTRLDASTVAEGSRSWRRLAWDEKLTDCEPRRSGIDWEREREWKRTDAEHFLLPEWVVQWETGICRMTKGRDGRKPKIKRTKMDEIKEKSRWEAASGMASGAVCGCANWRRGEGEECSTQGRPNERPLRQVSVELEISQKWYRRKSGGSEK